MNLSLPELNGRSHFAMPRAGLLVFSLIVMCGLPIESVTAQERAPIAHSRAEMLSLLVEQPEIERLRQLVAASGDDSVVPLELCKQEMAVENRKVGPVWRIPVGKDFVTVVKASVRPKDVALSPEILANLQADLRRRMPEAAFLFDTAGKLVARLGGHFGPTGSTEDVDVWNLGPEEDWFVRVMCFEKHPPIDFRWDYYRIAEKPIASLRVFAYPNGNPWSWGPKKVIRYGSHTFNTGKGQSLPFNKLGTTPGGTLMPRELIWDADNNRFCGAPVVSCDNRPLYEVDTKWSQEFEPIERKSNQMLFYGGARDYDSWHAWWVLVPDGAGAAASLHLPLGGANATDREVVKDLRPGLHLIQIQVKPADGQQTAVVLHIDEEAKQTFAVPVIPTAEQPAAVEVIQLVDPFRTVRLLQVPLNGTKLPLTLTIIPAS